MGLGRGRLGVEVGRMVVAFSAAHCDPFPGLHIRISLSVRDCVSDDAVLFSPLAPPSSLPYLCRANANVSGDEVVIPGRVGIVIPRVQRLLLQVFRARVCSDCVCGLSNLRLRSRDRRGEPSFLCVMSFLSCCFVLFDCGWRIFRCLIAGYSRREIWESVRENLKRRKR